LLPGAAFSVALPTLAAHQTLPDDAYAPWPTPLARTWQEVGGRVVHGLEMLVHQAVHQIRIFVAGDAAAPLADEAVVIEAMRAAARSSAVELSRACCVG